MQAPQLFSDKMAESLPQHLGIQRKSISIPIQRKDFVPPHLMSIQETNMDVMDSTPLSSSYSAGFRPVSPTHLYASAGCCSQPHTFTRVLVDAQQRGLCKQMVLLSVAAFAVPNQIWILHAGRQICRYTVFMAHLQGCALLDAGVRDTGQGPQAVRF